MIQQTNRLRDTLARRGFWVDGNVLPKLGEHEFVTPVVNGNFPDEFRVETLQNYCSDGWSELDLYSIPADGRVRVDRHPIRDCSESAEFSALWLTPRLFISKYAIFDDALLRHDFSVAWGTRESHRKNVFSVYSLSSFEEEGSDDPSPLPLEMLRHLFTLLPLDNVSEFGLGRKTPHRCPVQLVMAFLSIIPQDAHWNRPAKETWTEVAVDYDFSADDLRTILSHPFHPAINLSLSTAALQIMRDPVSLGEYIQLLRDAPHLRAVTLPRELVEAHSTSDSPAFEEIVFRSPALSIFYTRGKMSPSWLHTIASAHSVTALHIKSASCGWEEQWQDPLRSSIQPFFTKDAALEQLTIRLSLVSTQHRSNNLATLGQIFLQMANVMATCTSRKLDFVNVLVDLDFVNVVPNNQQINVARDFWTNTRVVGRVKAWDEQLFPCLVLNFCRNRLQILPKGGVMPLAIKAVNEGVIYHKTTHHVPFDMSSANAGVIYLLMKTEACRVLHDSAVNSP
jgi:hypothetical protein